MSFPLICRACGARLKLPSGSTKKKARCPKCRARVNVTAVLDATAYMPALTDLPSPAAKPATASRARTVTPPPSPAKPPDDAPLSLDDDPPPANSPGYLHPALPVPAGSPPFRTPAQVTADSARLFTGPCEVVLVPHGLFLESVPYRPFLYVPVGSPVDTPGPSEMTVFMPDGRSVTVEFAGGNARRVAEDAAAFLRGARAAPNPREYRGMSRWPLWIALIVALVLIGVVAYLAGRHNAARAEVSHHGRT